MAITLAFSSLGHCLLPLLVLLLPLLLLVSSDAQISQNFTLGSSLVARENGSFWASPLGDFAFGFQQVGIGSFLLAIWFNKIPEKTIVWSANRDNLVQSRSRVQLTTDGDFMLSGPKGEQNWKADLNGSRVAYAAMLDTGNFVLVGHNSTYLWQSFSHPTDTILPTQILDFNTNLFARFSQTNYSSGRFMFAMQADGNLVLYTTDFPLQTNNYAYWASNSVASGFQVIYNESGDIYLMGNNRSKLNDVLSNKAPAGEFYQRAIIEYDGVFRQYVYPGSMSTPSLLVQALLWPGPLCPHSYPKISAQELLQVQAVELVGSTATAHSEMIRDLFASALLVMLFWIYTMKQRDAHRTLNRRFVKKDHMKEVSLILKG